MAQTTNPLITGLTVTSTSTPSLNGTYRLNGDMFSALLAEAAAVALNNSFADGTANLNWPDSGGAVHAFDVAQFKPFAAAMFSFYNLTMMYELGLSANPPATSATIP